MENTRAASPGQSDATPDTRGDELMAPLGEPGGLRIRGEELDFDDDQIFHYEGIPFTGVAYYDDEEDGGTSEEEYVDGLRDGGARVWYASGALRSEGSFLLGVAHGRHRTFREDGTLESVNVYEFGFCLESSVFDESGNVVERFQLPEDSPSYAILRRWRADFGRL
jgi:antitoxin component YwqK of YwqJK toxin-antitoxin module